MANIKLKQFGGIAPKQHRANLKDVLAEVAENLDLSADTLRGWRKPKHASDKTGLSIWHEQCCFISDANCDARILWKEIDCGRLFGTQITGFNYPVQGTLNEDCTVSWCRLGFPCDDMPAPALTAGLPTNDFNREARVYVYTLVNQWGEESIASLPSVVIDVAHGTPVIVAGLPISYPEYCVTKIRIYRLTDRYRRGIEPLAMPSDQYFMVGEIPFSTPVFTDTATSLGKLLDSQDNGAIPDDLYDLVYWRSGQLAGLRDRYMMFSEPNRFHGWNDAYTLQFHDKPLRLIASEVTGYVLTDGAPVVVNLIRDCKAGNCHQLNEIPEPHPIISTRSAALWQNSVVFASHDGLIAIDPSGTVRNLTAEFYDKQSWLNIQPSTMQGVVHDGVYYGFCKDYALRLRLPDNVYENQDVTALTTLTLRPNAVYRSMNDELYLSFDNFTDVDGTVYDGTYRWNAANDFMQWRWKSKLFNAGGKYFMSAYRLLFDCGAVNVKTFVDCRLVKDREITTNKPYRLPNGYAGIEYQVELTSTSSEVREYVIASDIMEMVA